MKNLIVLVLSLLVVCVSGGSGFAKDCPVITDLSDYPDIPVYKDACLIGGRNGEFAKYVLPTGPIAKGFGANQAVTSENLEGTLNRRLYVAPEGTSATDLFQNYVQGLEAAGYSILFSCVAKECGSNNQLLGKKIIYPSDRRLKNIKGLSDQAFGPFADEHYLAAKSKDGMTSIAVYVSFNDRSPMPN